METPCKDKQETEDKKFNLFSNSLFFSFREMSVFQGMNCVLCETRSVRTGTGGASEERQEATPSEPHRIEKIKLEPTLSTIRVRGSPV